MDRRKILDWITYVVNMLVVLPFFGLISCGVAWFVVRAFSYPASPPEWAHISVAVVIDLLLIVLWGRHQYRVLILKNPRLPRVTWKSLLFLIGFTLAAFLLFLGLPAWLNARAMNKTREELRQHQELRDKVAGEWEALLGQEGCLISAADIRFSIEGSIFAKEDWQSFFASAREENARLRYIIQQFSSRRPTKIHICNFRYATEGEVAVFAAQQILRKNWYEYNGPEERIKEIARTETASGKALLVKEVLEDEELCAALQEYFRQSAPR